MEKLKLEQTLYSHISMEDRLLIIKIGVAITGTLIFILLITLLFGLGTIPAQSSKAYIENCYSSINYSNYGDTIFYCLL